MVANSVNIASGPYLQIGDAALVNELSYSLNLQPKHNT